VRRLGLTSALCSVLLAFSTPLAAQGTRHDSPDVNELVDLPLEDLLNVKVYAASKFVQDVAHAPASVSIITAGEIRTHGYRTLADALRSVRGFYVTYDRNYSYLGVRGFSRPGDFNSRVLLLVNGHRLNDNIFEQALLGTESPLDIALVERIEVIRGPSSSLYGTSAFLAVVNVITRAGRSIHGVEVEARSGSQLLRSGRVTVGGRRRNGFEGLVSVSGLASAGNRRLHFPEFSDGVEGGTARDADGDKSTSLFATAAGRGLNLQIGFGSRTKTIPTAAFGTIFNDTRTVTRDRRGFVDLQYTRRLGQRTTFQARGSYDRYRYDGTFAYEDGLFVDGAVGAWATAEAAVVRQFDRQALTAGLESRTNLRQSQSARDQTGVLLDDDRHSRTAALYVEDEVRVTANLLVNAGIRWDEYFETFGATVNPRVGVIVTPWTGTALKLLYGRAFRAPNPFELYYDQNSRSAQLSPERIATFEVAWEQGLSKRLRVIALGFRNRVGDLIGQESGSDTLDGLYYANGASADATGVEFEVQADVAGNAHLRLTHAFQSVEDATTHRRLSNAPRNLARAVLDVPLGQTSWIVAIDTALVGDRYAVSGADVRGACVTNLTLSRTPPARGLGVGATVRNLFGTEYGDPGSAEHRQAAIPQDGPTFDFRATWRF
jgi:outer membrane receptor for ferrienterochelin and colicins